jgi:hypothetical protein
MPVLATNRVTSDNLELLAELRRDRVRQERPAQLAERAALVADLAPPDAATQKEQAALASELAKAERAVDEARARLDDALNRNAELTRARNGRSHGALQFSETARRRLRELSHPVLPFSVSVLQRALYDLCAVTPTLVAIEHTEETVEPSDAEKRQSWFVRPRTRATHTPRTSHADQVALMDAISNARERIASLAYEPIDDDALVARVREEVDALVATRVPLALSHINLDLVNLRQKLNGDALSLWSIGEESIA